MSHDLFLSYKSGDEAHAARLAEALERAGFSLWWDRRLLPAEGWREAIAAALDASRLVLVLWTPASTGPEGAFVRDEAARGLARHALIPLIMERTTPPLGFGEVQGLDLIGWRGSPRDPRFADLVALLRARLSGAEAPKMQGRMRLLLRRLRLGAAALGASGVIAFAADVNSIQVQICSLPPRPFIADGCGALGLGGQPGRAERLAWAKTPINSCPALRAHVNAFPDGVYRARAADLLAARRSELEVSWVPVEKRLPLSASVEAHGDASGPERARAQGAADAERLCRGFAAGTLYRYKGAAVVDEVWKCDGGGPDCGFEGWVVCAFDQRVETAVEICGPVPGGSSG